MSKNRVIYNIQNLSVGPAPSTGYHFLNATGLLNDGPHVTDSNFNLVQPLQRIQSFNYQIDVEPYDYRSIGFYGNIDSKIIEQPIVNFTFDYLQNGIGNEAKCGFYVNHPRYDTEFSGSSKYSNNFGVFLLSGFLPNLDPVKDNSEIGWPLSYRDRRNFFLSINQSTSDLNTSSFDPLSIDVVGLGNCYVSNFSTRAAIGSFPMCSLSYIAENMQFYNRGSGELVPALSPKSGNNVPVQFRIPSHVQDKNILSALKPGDITLNIQSIPAYTGISTLAGTGYSNGAGSNTITSLHQDFNNLSVQSYNISLPFQRETLKSLNYKLPIDRKLVFPVFADIGLNVLANDLITGSLLDLKNKNSDYNLTIKLNNPLLGKSETGVAVQYNILRAKYAGSSYDSSIGPNSEISLNYTVELTPDNLNRGLFVSGLLNSQRIASIGDFWQEENGAFILTEAGETIESSSYMLYY